MDRSVKQRYCFFSQLPTKQIILTAYPFAHGGSPQSNISGLCETGPRTAVASVG